MLSNPSYVRILTTLLLLVGASPTRALASRGPSSSANSAEATIGKGRETALAKGPAGLGSGASRDSSSTRSSTNNSKDRPVSTSSLSGPKSTYLTAAFAVRTGIDEKVRHQRKHDGASHSQRSGYSDRAGDGTFDRQQRRRSKTASAPSNPGGRHSITNLPLPAAHAAAILPFSLGRVLRLTAVAFAASEVLAYAGIFGEHESTGIRHFIEEVIPTSKAQLRQRWNTFKSSAINLYDEARGPDGILNFDRVKEVLAEGGRGAGDFVRPVVDRYRSLPERSKFATGTAVGLTSTPLLIRWTVKAVKVVGLTYVALELCDALGIIGDDESGLGKLAQAENNAGLCIRWVEDVLDRTRVTIREKCKPQSVLDRIEGFIDDDGAAAGGLAAGAVVSLLI